MLTLFDDRSRFGRRDFLRVGGLALGGTVLGFSRDASAQSQRPPVTGKSVVFLFLQGGPPQHETFDPKMTAPVEIRSTTGELATTIPGITFGGTLPRLAALANHLSVVRSYTTGDGNHDIKPIVGRDTFGANLGSIYSLVAGATNPSTGMPTNAILYPRAIDGATQETTMQFGRFGDTGNFGSTYAPFVPGSGDAAQENLRLRLPLDRLDDRRLLLTGLDQLKYQAESRGVPSGFDGLRGQAFEALLGGVADAFDLSKEDPRTIARYDTAPLMRPEDIDRKWNNYNNYVDNGKTLGKLMLLARRLCEAGCKFVTVTTNFVWDFHADVNNAGAAEGMRYMGLPLDHAVSAFIEDVHARGLSDQILLVASGEMGRTPKINKTGGRDHWGRLAPLLLSGGGLNMGQVIGQSTSDAGEPRSEPQTMKHLIATIAHTLFDVPELRVMRGIPNEIGQTMVGWEPIAGLM